MTLQTALAKVVESLNRLSRDGLFRADGVKLHFRFMQLKGDWKFIKQALNLVRYAGSENICWACMASKGNHHPAMNFTDVSEHAPWRATVNCSPEPWSRKPALRDLCHWSLQKVGPDILHVYHLGVGRDLMLGCM